MPRRLLALCFLCLLAGCAKPALPDLVVRAASSVELASFRSDLGARFTAEEIAPFDTALQELQLDAMNREISPASAREADMLATVNGKTVREAQILGWTARRARLLREADVFSTMLERDLKTQQEAPATGTSQALTNRVQNAQDILARLARDLADTNSHLTTWAAPPR